MEAESHFPQTSNPHVCKLPLPLAKACSHFDTTAAPPSPPLSLPRGRALVSYFNCFIVPPCAGADSKARDQNGAGSGLLRYALGL